MKCLSGGNVFTIWILYLACTWIVVTAKNDLTEETPKNTTEDEAAAGGTRKQRSPIGNIARLLFGGTYVSVQIGNMIPDHPLVRYPAPIQATSRNMDNVIAAVPGMNGRRLETSASSPSSPFHPGSHPLGPTSRATHSYRDLQRMYSNNDRSPSLPITPSTQYAWSGINPAWPVRSSPSNFLLNDHRPFTFQESMQQNTPFSRQPIYPQSVQTPGLPSYQSSSFDMHPTSSPSSYPSFPQFQPGPSSTSSNSWSSSSSSPWQPGPIMSDTGSRHDNFGPPYYPYDDTMNNHNPNPGSGQSYTNDNSYPPPTPAPFSSSFDNPGSPQSDFNSYPPPPPSHDHNYLPPNEGPSQGHESYPPSPPQTQHHGDSQSNYYSPPTQYEHSPPSDSMSMSMPVSLPTREMYRDDPVSYPYSTMRPLVYKSSSKSRRPKSHKKHRDGTSYSSSSSSSSKSKAYRKHMKEMGLSKPVLEYYPKTTSPYDTRRYDYPRSRGHGYRSSKYSRKPYNRGDVGLGPRFDFYTGSESATSKQYVPTVSVSASTTVVKSVPSTSVTSSSSSYTKKGTKSSVTGSSRRYDTKSSKSSGTSRSYTLAPADSYKDYYSSSKTTGKSESSPRASSSSSSYKYYSKYKPTILSSGGSVGHGSYKYTSSPSTSSASQSRSFGSSSGRSMSSSGRSHGQSKGYTFHTTRYDQDVTSARSSGASFNDGRRRGGGSEMKGYSSYAGSRGGSSSSANSGWSSAI